MNKKKTEYSGKKTTKYTFNVKTYKIDLKVFHNEIFVAVGDDAKKLYKEWYPDGHFMGAGTFNHEGEITILFPKEITPEYISHEATHAAQMILQFIEYKNDNIVDEMPAYIIGYITKKIFEIIKKEKIRLVMN